MTSKSKRKIIVAVTALFIIVAFFALTWWSYPYLTSDNLEVFVKDAGVLGPAVLMGYVLIAHIVAPVGGLPAFIVGVAVFGIFQTTLYIYAASMVSAVINFYISRRFGRPLVQLFVGRKGVGKIDEWSLLLGRRVLFAGRVFALFLFEELSYAAGLTAVKFRDYMLITAVGTAIPSFILMFAFRNADFESVKFFMISLGAIIFVGVASASILIWFLKYRQRKRG
jgi:uncharacterized membrane protein YdjX (TVP38/TMEM64 family)